MTPSNNIANRRQVNRFIAALPGFILLLVSGCVAYRVQPSPDLEFDHAVDSIATADDLSRGLSVRKNEVIPTTIAGAQTEAVFCSEPVVTMLTLGVVPRVCTSTYRATLTLADNHQEEGYVRNYEVRAITGWLALLLLPAPDWKYGHKDDWSDTITQQVADQRQ